MKKSAFVALFALALVAAEASVTSAQAAFDLGVVGNFSMVGVKESPTPTYPYDGKMAIGFGAIASFNLIPGLSLDAGLIYAGRKLSQNDTTQIIDMNSKFLEIPVVARYTILPMLSLGAGLYYASAMGDISATVTPNGGTATASTVTFASAGYKTSDMGLILSAGLKVPAPGFHIIANINYLMGMADINATAVAGSSTKWGGLELQGGVSFGL